MGSVNREGAEKRINELTKYLGKYIEGYEKDESLLRANVKLLRENDSLKEKIKELVEEHLHKEKDLESKFETQEKEINNLRRELKKAKDLILTSTESVNVTEGKQLLYGEYRAI